MFSSARTLQGPVILDFPLISDVFRAESPVTELQRSGSLESVTRVFCRLRLRRSRGGQAACPGCFSVQWDCVPPSSPFCLRPPSSPSGRVVVPAGLLQLWAQPRFSDSGAWRAGGGAVLPPPTPSWALPSFPLPSLWSGAQAWGPSPVWQGEGFSSERGQCPSAAWWSRGPHPQGSPPLPHPGCSGLGAGPGGWLRASAGGAPGPAWGIQC